jgi:hypothetical protein
LAFDDFAHAGTFDCGNVNEGVLAAIVRERLVSRAATEVQQAMYR